MPTWLVESKFTSKGHHVDGTFDDALSEARAQCAKTWSVWTVSTVPDGEKVAEVGPWGVVWQREPNQR